MTWRDRAACADTDPDLFFSEDTVRGTYKQAIAICNDCPVKDDCLDYALKENLRDGVWGGRTPDERQRIRRRLGMPINVVSEPQPCGTNAAYVRHIKQKTPVCEPCREAKRVYSRKQRGAA